VWRRGIHERWPGAATLAFTQILSLAAASRSGHHRMVTSVPTMLPAARRRGGHPSIRVKMEIK
jgi:hypothetical protein